MIAIKYMKNFGWRSIIFRSNILFDKSINILHNEVFRKVNADIISNTVILVNDKR